MLPDRLQDDLRIPTSKLLMTTEYKFLVNRPTRLHRQWHIAEAERSVCQVAWTRRVFEKHNLEWKLAPLEVATPTARERAEVAL